MMFQKFKTKYQELQQLTQDYQEYKNNEHVWKGQVITQINNEKPQVFTNCFLKAWIAYIYCNYGNTTFATNDITGTSRTINAQPATARIEETSANSTQGIIVGTSSTAVAVADHALNAVIAHGSAAGELLYGATSVSAFEASTTEASWSISRNFTNLSGGTITVREIGLVMDISTSFGFNDFLVDHTLSTNALSDGDRLMVTYKIQQS